MIDIRFFIVLVAFVLLLVGFYAKSYVLTALSSMLLMVYGIYVIWYEGLPNADALLTNSVGIIMICIGGYVFLRSTWEQYKDH